MKIQLSSAVQALTPSATIAITAKAKQLQAAGKPVISFAAGQPDFDTPDVIKNAAKKALDQGFTKYTASSGIPELKDAIVEKLNRENKIRYKSSQVLICNGAKQALFEVIFSLAGKGDEVAFQVPYWVSYPDMVKAAGATPVIIESNKKFKMTPETLKKALTKNTKVIILNSPSNPTGVVYSKKELVALSKVLLNSSAIILSDECYDRFYYGDTAPISIASINKELYKRTITINSASKSYSMTGWRVGFAAGDDTIIQAAGALQSHLTGNACSFAQKGADAAYRKAQKFPDTMRKEFIKRRDVMVAGLNNIEGINANTPDGAFYVFADISKLTTDSFAFATELLDRANVAVIPGVPFGCEGYIRFSFATSMKNINEGLIRLEKFVNKKQYGK